MILFSRTAFSEMNTYYRPSEIKNTHYRPCGIIHNITVTRGLHNVKIGSLLSVTQVTVVTITVPQSLLANWLNCVRQMTRSIRCPQGGRRVQTLGWSRRNLCKQTKPEFSTSPYPTPLGLRGGTGLFRAPLSGWPLLKTMYSLWS
jgi:hypothetical protein